MTETKKGKPSALVISHEAQKNHPLWDKNADLGPILRGLVIDDLGPASPNATSKETPSTSNANAANAPAPTPTQSPKTSTPTTKSQLPQHKPSPPPISELAILENILQAALTNTAHIEEVIRATLTRITQLQSSGSVDEWIRTQLALNDQERGPRSSYSARLSDAKRTRLERAQAHRGHDTFADAMDEALFIGTASMLLLPARPGGTQKKRGPRAKSPNQAKRSPKSKI